MKLSIITICYNDRVGFEKTAKSVAAQTCLKDVEWIIVDGASTDGSVEVIQQSVETMRVKTPMVNVSWKSEPDKGIYNAMNKGICQAEGEYLLFMNAGDRLYADDTLQKALPLLNGKDIYVGDIVNDTPKGHQLVEFPRQLTPQVILNQIIFRFIPHQSSFIKRELFDKYGMYREDLCIASDWYFFYDALVMHGATIETIPMPIALFDITGISSTDTNRVNERITSQADIPCQQALFNFYRENVEITNAVNATSLGRLLIRIYFFIYRKFITHKT